MYWFVDKKFHFWSFLGLGIPDTSTKNQPPGRPVLPPSRPPLPMSAVASPKHILKAGVITILPVKDKPNIESNLQADNYVESAASAIYEEISEHEVR